MPKAPQVVMPLRVRLALLFALGTAVVIAVAGVGFVLQLRLSLDASLDPGLRARAIAVASEFGSDAGPPQLGSPDQITQIRSLDDRLLASTPAAGPGALLDPAQLRQALADEVSFTAIVHGDRSRVLARVSGPAGQRVLVVAGTGTDVSDAAVERVRSGLLLGAFPAVVLAGAGAWLLAGAALRPVDRMRREATQISARDTDRRLAVPATRDEIAALATTMNALLDRLQDALQRQRGFVADAGHELRTPLAILRTELELAARPGRAPAELVAAITLAGEETDRLIRIAEDLLLLARADSNQPFLHPEPLSLNQLLDAAARAGEARAAGRAITVQVEVNPVGLRVTADSGRLRQVLDNLLDNAIRHAPPDSTVELTASSTSGPVERSGPAAVVTIEVADRGGGFPSAFLPHAFERFRRAEDARTRNDGGTGLGLAIVRAIAEAHGGRATATNRRGGGARVSLTLPAAATSAPDTATSNPPRPN